MKKLLLIVIALCAGVGVYAQTSSEDWILRADNIDKSNYYGVTSANGVIGLISSPKPFAVKEVALPRPSVMPISREKSFQALGSSCPFSKRGVSSRHFLNYPKCNIS